MPNFEQQFQTAVQHFNAGRLKEAQAAGIELLKRKPRNSSLLQLLGEIARQTGEVSAAEDLFRRAIASDAKDANAYLRLGRVLAHLGRREDAIQVLQSAVRVQPNFAEALCLLGDMFQDQGHESEARQHYDQALRVNPNLALVHFNLANDLLSKRQMEVAAQHYRQALRLKPDYWQCQVNLGLLLRAEGKFQQSRDLFKQALSLRPDMTVVYTYLLDLMLSLCELSAIKAMSEEIHAVVRRCIANEQERDFAALMYLSPLLSVSKQDYHALSQKMDRLLSKAGSRQFTARALPGKKLRIGYVSPDFGDHPISHVTLRVFGEHDRGQFEVIGYSISTRVGPTDRVYASQIQRSCDDFVDLSVLTVPQAAERIVADGVDILVNLSGYMCPQSLEVFALRPAPIQVYWLGQGGGLGLSFIDYVIGDAVVIPPNEEGEYKEKIVRMPDLYHCTDTPPISDVRQSRAEFGLDDSAFVFCAFNNPNKIDNGVFDVWMNILGRVPNSQIWLSNTGSDGALERNLRSEAQLRGVNPDRLVFASRLADKSLHFARHRLADLFLDTFVYTAATTAIDALWAGLPTLTRPGENFFTRICATFLSNVGLKDMICASTREYEDRAVYFANNPAALAKVRERLARNLRTEPLFNPPRFVKNLEKAYLAMWQRHASGEPPVSLDVAKLPLAAE
jgi:predicted O-linked N-acetylglucosamine transferase (SPINDLY family)